MLDINVNANFLHSTIFNPRVYVGGQNYDNHNNPNLDYTNTHISRETQSIEENRQKIKTFKTCPILIVFLVK